MIPVHMRFVSDLYASLRASWCSIRDVSDILVTSKGRAGAEERTTQQLARETSVSDGFQKGHPIKSV